MAGGAGTTGWMDGALAVISWSPGASGFSEVGTPGAPELGRGGSAARSGLAARPAGALRGAGGRGVDTYRPMSVLVFLFKIGCLNVLPKEVV